MQSSGLAGWVGDLDAPTVEPLLGGLRWLLDWFVEIGLGYLSFMRPCGTLSGGEAQRTMMIRRLGSSLSDVTYVFDEPTSGLHLADVKSLLDRLVDGGTSVIVIEHRQAVMAHAHWIIDLGPGAGIDGGRVAFERTPRSWWSAASGSVFRPQNRAEVRTAVGSTTPPACAARRPAA